MKKQVLILVSSIIATSSLVSSESVASTMVIEGEAFAPLIYELGRTQDQSWQGIVSTIIKENWQLGVEYQYQAGQGLHGYSSTFDPYRDYLVSTRKLGLRLVYYMSGFQSGGFFLGVTPGIASRKVRSAFEREVNQNSGYATAEVGYRFSLLPNTSLAISLAESWTGFHSRTNFDGTTVDGTYSETIEVSQDDLQLRALIGLVF
jgi:hypothetical protein